MQIGKGQRLPLSSILEGVRFGLSIRIKSPHVIDLACFGLDAEGKLSDDRYMVFFNQPRAPCGSVELLHGNDFEIELEVLPASVDRLVFAASIDGVGAMRDLQACHFIVKDGAGRELADCPFSGAAFADEKAVMLAEVYRKSGQWRLALILQGFNEGLSALVSHFGGEIGVPPAAAPVPVQARVSLEKRIGEAAPHLINLAKKARISLDKARLTDAKARVGLVLDASGSMRSMYAIGQVQEVVDRLLPLAIHFDDDGELDCWAFAEEPVQLSAITLANHKNFIDTDQQGWRAWSVGRRINDEPKVMRRVIDHYQQSPERTPIYVLFISDGGVHENRAITRLMVEAAELPIFWQFVGLGGRNYGVLEKLDDMTGRVVDNCSFFALDDLHDIAEEVMYDRMMEEFPDWIREATLKGIVR